MVPSGDQLKRAPSEAGDGPESMTAPPVIDAIPIGRIVVIALAGSVYHRLNAIRVLSGDQTKSCSNQASDSLVRCRMSVPSAFMTQTCDTSGFVREPQPKATIVPSGDQWTADRSCWLPARALAGIRGLARSRPRS